MGHARVVDVHVEPCLNLMSSAQFFTAWARSPSTWRSTVDRFLDVGDASLQFGNSISDLTHDDYAFPL